MKQPKCTFCLQTGHYRINCFSAPRAAIKSKTYKYVPKDLKPLKSPVSKPKAPKSRRKLAVETLDRIFSKFVRLSEATNGYIHCITCSDRVYWKESDNCHFIQRRYFGTRWSEVNCHAGCKTCNQENDGELEQYERYLIDRYGEEVIEELQQQSKKRIATVEIEELIIIYREKLLTLSE